MRITVTHITDEYLHLTLSLGNCQAIAPAANPQDRAQDLPP
jgi:hypothetical protein